MKLLYIFFKNRSRFYATPNFQSQNGAKETL